MATKNIPIEIHQGTAWKANVKVTTSGVVRDITGYKAYMQIRENVGSPILVDLSVDNGSITLDLETNTFKFYISSTITKTLTFKRAEYDIFVVAPDSDPEKVVTGTVSLVRSITVL